MKIAKEISYNTMLPPWYGVAWNRMDRNTIVCYPVPLNMLAAWIRRLVIWMRHGGRMIPANSRDAYAQGLRDGRRAR